MFKARMKAVWEDVSSSYWFVPSLMVGAAVLLAFGMTSLDEVVPDEWLAGVPWLYTGTAEGARSLLAVIASSMVGIAGVVFSITIVALTLASNQFGPRLLRNFTRDKGNQVTLGTFLAAFLYCLLVLRKVQGGDESGGAFVPQLSLLAAVLAAIAGLGVLIYFIDHAAASIQAPNVVSAVSGDLMRAIDVLFPESIGQAAEGTGEGTGGEANAPDPTAEAGPSEAVPAGRGGYLLRIEADQLMARAEEHDLLIRVERRPGQFVQPDDPVVRVWPRERASEDVLRELGQTFAVGDRRSTSQDAEFAAEQLVEIAARALSPGINDPFTAMACVDRLGEALSALASRKCPSPLRRDESGRLRVVAYPKTYVDMLDVAFNQIRQYAANSPDVLLRMLEATERVAHRIRRGQDARDLAEHLEMIHKQAVAAVGNVGGDRDLRKVKERYAAARHVLAARAAAW